MITDFEACQILKTITDARGKKGYFQLVEFETSEYGLCVNFRSTLKDPSKVGGYFRKCGLKAAPTMLENDGVFTIWLRQEAE